MQKVTPFLWFDDQAARAAEFYVSIFPNAQIISSHGGATTFELYGVRYMAFNGGKHYRLNPAISLSVDCEDQAELDYYWEKLLQGGEPSRCGWLVDRFGLSWQIIPRALPRLLNDPDPLKSKRVLEAMLGMVKLNVAELEKAHSTAP